MLVIVDRSSVETECIAREAEATVIDYGRNCGCGAALQTAFIEAHRAGGSQLVTLDADDQHDAAELPALVEELGSN